MSAEVIPLIEVQYSRPRGLAAIYDYVNSLLTSVRASYLDLLINLAGGPAALQQYLGTPADVQAMNTTLFAAVKYIEQQVCNLRLPVQQVNSGNGSVIILQPDNHPTTPLWVPCPVGSSGPGSYINDSNAIQFAQSSTFQWSQTIAGLAAAGGCIQSVATLSPSQPAAQQTTPVQTTTTTIITQPPVTPMHSEVSIGDPHNASQTIVMVGSGTGGGNRGAIVQTNDGNTAVFGYPPGSTPNFVVMKTDPAPTINPFAAEPHAPGIAPTTPLNNAHLYFGSDGTDGKPVGSTLYHAADFHMDSTPHPFHIEPGSAVSSIKVVYGNATGVTGI